MPAASSAIPRTAARYIGQRMCGPQPRWTAWRAVSWRSSIDHHELGFYDLRRVDAPQLVEAVVEVKVSQELIGHEDITLTRGLYAPVGDEIKRLGEDVFGDDGLHDLRGAAVDPGDAGVGPGPADGVLGHVAVAAEQLEATAT
jgi:hypothetical protein